MHHFYQQLARSINMDINSTFNTYLHHWLTYTSYQGHSGIIHSQSAFTFQMARQDNLKPYGIMECVNVYVAAHQDHVRLAKHLQHLSIIILQSAHRNRPRMNPSTQIKIINHLLCQAPLCIRGKNRSAPHGELLMRNFMIYFWLSARHDGHSWTSCLMLSNTRTMQGRTFTMSKPMPIQIIHSQTLLALGLHPPMAVLTRNQFSCIW
jgi:hypothetical protein